MSDGDSDDQVVAKILTQVFGGVDDQQTKIAGAFFLRCFSPAVDYVPAQHVQRAAYDEQAKYLGQILLQIGYLSSDHSAFDAAHNIAELPVLDRAASAGNWNKVDYIQIKASLGGEVYSFFNALTGAQKWEEAFQQLTGHYARSSGAYWQGGGRLGIDPADLKQICGATTEAGVATQKAARQQALRDNSIAQAVSDGLMTDPAALEDAL